MNTLLLWQESEQHFIGHQNSQFKEKIRTFISSITDINREGYEGKFLSLCTCRPNLRIALTTQNIVRKFRD